MKKIVTKIDEMARSPTKIITSEHAAAATTSADDEKINSGFAPYTPVISVVHFPPRASVSIAALNKKARGRVERSRPPVIPASFQLRVGPVHALARPAFA